MNNKVINHNNTKWDTIHATQSLFVVIFCPKIMTRIDSMTFHHLWVRMAMFISTNVSLEMCYDPIICTLCQTFGKKTSKQSPHQMG
jgi:hypothetical protein